VPFLSRTLPAHGDSDALVSAGHAVSVRSLSQAAEKAARRLVTFGIRPGEVVALKGHPDPSVLVALHGIWKAGAVPLPMNPRWTEMEEAAAVRLLRPGVALLGKGMTRVAGTTESLALEPSPSTEAEPFEEIGLDISPLPSRGLGMGAAAHLLTSGTSGEPRRVSVTFQNLRASALAAGKRLGLRPSDRWLASLSLAHVGGLALVSRAALLGSSLLLDGSYEADRLQQLLARGELTHAALVPVMLHRLLEGWGGGRPPASLRCLLIGGAGAEEALVEQALALGFPLALTYGLTEATSQVATAPPELVRAKPGTVGAPLPGVDLRIAPGGEILVRGATVAPGQGGADGWLHTGDLGRLDGDGHLWVTGRISSRIISGGVNVDPAEVEAVLRTHPGVRDVAVVGVPDPEWGERVVAALVVDGRPRVREELDNLARLVLSPAKRPRDFREVGSLPRNPNGKVDRAGVRALFPSRATPDRGAPR
jgi:O-succinylbenzoic acid--CoA ligase